MRGRGVVGRSSGSLLALLAAALVSACAKPQPPTLTLRSLRVNAVSSAGLTLGLDFDVQNPNGFPLMARSVDGTLEVGDRTAVGHAHATLASPIPAKSTSTVASTLEVGMANLPALVPLALAGSNVRFAFHGTAEVGGERINVRLPFEAQGELTQAQLIQAGLRAMGR